MQEPTFDCFLLFLMLKKVLIQYTILYNIQSLHDNTEYVIFTDIFGSKVELYFVVSIVLVVQQCLFCNLDITILRQTQSTLHCSK